MAGIEPFDSQRIIRLCLAHQLTSKVDKGVDSLNETCGMTTADNRGPGTKEGDHQGSDGAQQCKGDSQKGYNFLLKTMLSSFLLQKLRTYFSQAKGTPKAQGQDEETPAHDPSQELKNPYEPRKNNRNSPAPEEQLVSVVSAAGDDIEFNLDIHDDISKQPQNILKTEKRAELRETIHSTEDILTNTSSAEAHFPCPSDELVSIELERTSSDDDLTRDKEGWKLLQGIKRLPRPFLKILFKAFGRVCSPARQSIKKQEDQSEKWQHHLRPNGNLKSTTWGQWPMKQTSVELVPNIATVAMDEIRTVLHQGEDSVAICRKGSAFRRIGSEGTSVSATSEDRLDTEPLELILDNADRHTVLPTATPQTRTKVVWNSVATVETDEIQTVLLDGGECVSICLKGSTFRRIGSAATPVSITSEDRLDAEPVELTLRKASNALLPTAPQPTGAQLVPDSVATIETDEIETVLQGGGENASICLKGFAMRRIVSADTQVAITSADGLGREPVDLNLEQTNRKAVMLTPLQTTIPRMKHKNGMEMRTSEKAKNVRRKTLMKKLATAIRKMV